MSLMHFLAVTRSIKPVKDQPSPYKMKQPILLPKFGPKGEGDVETDCPEVMPQAVQDTEEQVDTPVVAEARRGWQRLFGRGGRRERTGKPLVQTELSLETVRVMRNDLREHAGQLTSARKVKRSQKTIAVTDHWWTRLQRRLFARGRKQD